MYRTTALSLKRHAKKYIRLIEVKYDTRSEPKIAPVYVGEGYVFSTQRCFQIYFVILPGTHIYAVYTDLWRRFNLKQMFNDVGAFCIY